MSGAKVIAFPAREPDSHFGACPRCHRQDGYLNVHKHVYFVCQLHRVYWYAGDGLFSSWQDEDERVWAENQRKLLGFSEVEPYYAQEESESA